MRSFSLPLVPLLGCVESDGPVVPLDVSLQVEVAAGMPTVVEVSWEPVSGVDARVEFGPDTAYGLVARPAEAEPGRATLVGNPQDRDVHLRLVLSADGEDVAYPDHVVRTGSFDGSPPAPTVTTDDPDATWGRFVLIPAFEAGSNLTHLTIVDRAGEVVWWKEVPLFGPAAYVSRARGGVLFRVDGYADPDPNGRIVRLGWDGGELAEIASDLGHHDLLEHEDGTVVALEMVVQTVDGTDFVGDQLVEYAPDGTRAVVWDSFGTMTPVVPTTGGADLNPYGVDWTHANSVDYDPVTDRYLVSLYYLQQLVATDRATGEIDWELGAGTDDFAFAFDADEFGPQHAASWVDGGVLMFDNHDNKDDTSDETVSRAVRYIVDPVAGRVGLRDEWTPVEGRRTQILGDARLLADGSWYLSTGTLGVAQVVGVDRELDWELTFPTGYLLGRGAVLDGAPAAALR